MSWAAAIVGAVIIALATIIGLMLAAWGDNKRRRK